MEGVSLAPLLRGGELKLRPLPQGWELFGSRAFRDGPWKLVWKAGVRQWELYNLASDRSETADLASQHPDRVQSMAAGWQDWARKTEALIR